MELEPTAVLESEELPLCMPEEEVYAPALTVTLLLNALRLPRAEVSTEEREEVARLEAAAELEDILLCF